MALTSCDECGKELSEHAEACPYCGAPAKIALETYREKERIEWDAFIESDVGFCAQSELGYGNLTKENVSEVRSLNMNGDVYIRGPFREKLSVVPDLTRFESLCELVLDNNLIEDLTPLSGLGNLKTLRLKGNRISDISPLSGLKKLTLLELGSNELTDLTPLSELTELRTLHLDNCSLLRIDSLAKLKHLRTLSLQENSIRDISALAELTELQNLKLSDNSINNIGPLGELMNLKSLELSRNRIKDLRALQEYRNLQHLGISYNPIASVRWLVNLNSLQRLNTIGTNLSRTALSNLYKALPSCRITETEASAKEIKKESSDEGDPIEGGYKYAEEMLEEYLDSGDPDTLGKALSRLRKAAKCGDGYAIRRLAHALTTARLNGDGIHQNYIEESAWWMLWGIKGGDDGSGFPLMGESLRDVNNIEGSIQTQQEIKDLVNKIIKDHPEVLG